MQFEKTVFISHSSKDQEQSDRLVSALEARGVKCWVAYRDIEPGTNYPQEILKGIASCDAMIVLVSRNSLRSPHVEREVERAVSTGKPIYPIRLVDVEIAGSLEYLLSVSHQIDLFRGPADSAYENLAHAIKKGVSPNTGKPLGVSPKGNPLAWLAVAAVVLLVAAGVAYLALRPATDQPETTKVEQSEPSETELYVEMWYSENTGSSLLRGITANGYMYGFPVQDAPARLTIYDELPGGRFAKLADSKTRITSPGDHQAFEQLLAEKPEQPVLCLQYKGIDPAGRFAEYYYLRKFFQSATLGPAGSRVLKKEPNTNCESVLGISNVEDRTGSLADYEQRRRIERSSSFSEIYSVELIQYDNTGFKVTLYEQGGYEKKVDPDRVTNVTLRVFASEDGDNWKLYYTSQEGFAFTTIHYESIERPTPPFVRACVTTFLESEKTHVVEDGSWRRNGQKGRYDFTTHVPKQMFLDEEGTFCSAIDPDPSANVARADIDPAEIAVPADSGGEFDVSERATAISNLKAGNPAPFGPAVAGFRLGMPMEEAVSLAKQILPLAVRVDALGEKLWIYDKEPHGKPVLFIDPQEKRTIVLLPFRTADALAGIWMGYRPWQKRTITVPEYKKLLTEAFGPNLPADGDEYVNSATYVWSPSADPLCRSSAYDFSTDVWDLAENPLTTSNIKSALFLMKAPTPDPSLDNTPCYGFLMAHAQWVQDNPNFILVLFDPRALRDVQ